MSNLAYNFTERNVSLVLDGIPYTVSRDSGIFSQIVESLEDEDIDRLRTLMNPKQNMEVFSEGRITFDGRDLLFDGELLHNSINERLVFLWEQGLPVRSLLRFMDRLMENPSRRAVKELYSFLDATDIPITNDGHFLAYKRVRGNYTDIHSGRFDNSVGRIVEVRRNEVDEDPDRTCSHGLHVCSRDYLPCFGSFSDSNRVLIVKVNPVDVVAVPRDYNNAKMRVCRYEVMQDITDSYTPERDSMPSYHTNDFDSDVYLEESDDIYDAIRDARDELDAIGGLFDDEDDSFDDLRDDEPEYDTTLRLSVSNEHVTSNKLNEHQVRDIKRQLEQDEFTLVAIARQHGVNESTIRKIRDGITWSWVV